MEQAPQDGNISNLNSKSDPKSEEPTNAIPAQSKNEHIMVFHFDDSSNLERNLDSTCPFRPPDSMGDQRAHPSIKASSLSPSHFVISEPSCRLVL